MFTYLHIDFEERSKAYDKIDPLRTKIDVRYGICLENIVCPS